MSDLPVHPPVDLPGYLVADRLRAGVQRLHGPNPTTIESLSPALDGLTCLVPALGDWFSAAPGYAFTLAQPTWVLLAVHQLGESGLDDGWQSLQHGLVWRFSGGMRFHGDRIRARLMPAGRVEIPGHAGRSPRGWHARPHLVLLAAQLPEAPASGEDRDALLAHATRVETMELADGGLTACIQTRPALRLTRFSDGDSPSLLAPTEMDPSGVRTWFMEPGQTERSPLIANRQASCSNHGPAQADLTTGMEPSTGLELLWQVRLDSQSRTLRLRHGLRNHAAQVRTVALWPLVAGAGPQRMHTVLLGEADGSSVAGGIFPPLVEAHEEHLRGRDLHRLAGVHPGRQGLVLDGAAMTGTPWLKAGLRARDGIAALADGNWALRSQVTAADVGPYPEGDRNLTTYRSDHIIEIEHVGPLVAVAPGATIWLDQILSMHRIDSHAVSSPETLLAAVRDLPGV